MSSLNNEQAQTGMPRIKPVEVNTLDGDRVRLLNSVPTVNGKPLNVYSTLVHHPNLLRRIMATGAVFHDGQLAAPDREIAVLTVAARCGSNYVFEGHVPIATRAGISDEQVCALRDEIANLSLWDSHQKALITFVSDLLADDVVDDDSWNGVSFHDDPIRMIELISLVGFYRMMAEIANAVRMEPDGF